jgi:hypothetical protein
MVATGFKAGRFKAVGPRAASFTVWRFDEAAGFPKVAGFGEVTCFADLPCFGELLKISCSQPASLISIGRSTNAAIATMMVRQRGQTPKPDRANFLSDDNNPYSAAALRGRPTNPVGSPKRSTITAGKSLALLVTQAPERTA